MSGVLALLPLSGRPLPTVNASALLDAIAHRGDHPPRLWLDGRVALGHVNLPTTLEAEHEELPSCDPACRVWLTWGGRLDNRAELAQALMLDAATARTMTDSEP